MPVYLKVLILAVVQGITEFLPISSSGHLAIAGHFMGFKDTDSVNLAIVLHAGSLVAIVAYYRLEIWRIIRDFDWRMVLMLGIGTVPAVIVGLSLTLTGFDAKLEQDGLWWIAIPGLLVTAAILRFLHRPDPEGRPLAQMRWQDALVVGLLQAVAITPGISRSGSTISAGTRMGLQRTDAATFSFLLGIIAISGAVVLKARDVLEPSETQIGLGVLALGFVVSAAVSYVALVALIRTLKHGKFVLFSYYCLAVALCALVGAWLHG